MPTVYAYAACATCRKAGAWLRARDLAVQTVDIVTAPPSADALAGALSRSGLPLARFFNRSGQSYRQGAWKDKVAGLSTAAAAAALAADGKLIKRPLVLFEDGRVLVGFQEAEWEAAFVR